MPHGGFLFDVKNPHFIVVVFLFAVFFTERRGYTENLSSFLDFWRLLDPTEHACIHMFIAIPEKGFSTAKYVLKIVIKGR